MTVKTINRPAVSSERPKAEGRRRPDVLPRRIPRFVFLLVLCTVGLFAAAPLPGPAQPPKATLSFEASSPAMPNGPTFGPIIAQQPEQAPPPGKLPDKGTGNFKLPPNLAQAPPVVPPPAQAFPIDLCTALRLAEADNPTVGISRQAIQEALAGQLRANVLLLPSLRAGGNYHLHNGKLQTSFGELRPVDSSSLYFGGGARTLAAETVAFPMVQVLSPLADAIFEPLVARRLVAVRRNQSAATTNQILLEVATRFLELVSAQAEVAAIRASEENMNEIVKLTTIFAKTGQGREADADRARSEALLMRVEEEQAEERLAVASANLAELLNLDTATQLRPPVQATGMIDLVDLHNDLAALVVQAQTARPELAAIQADIARRQAQVREERIRPWVPTLVIGFSSGSFGGGTNRTDLVPVGAGFGRFGSRADFDAMAYWTVQNGGLGNLALQNQRRAQREIAAGEQLRLLNLVREQVVTAYQRAEAGLKRVYIAQNRLAKAEAGFRRDLERTKGNLALPIEVLNSANRLARARLEMINSYLEYNQAQFALFVALGQRPSSICPPFNCAAH